MVVYANVEGEVKYSIPKDGKNGWTAWFSPKHGHANNNYKMACCDCGLVHELQFRIKMANVDGHPKNSVFMRVRRNNRATGQMRRWKKY